jgi:hypothetical protein
MAATVAASTLNPELESLNSTWRWTPNANDHLIYDWVKMQGKTQAEVASLLNIHQGTVSRTIQRYERWQAHAKDREAGRLDHAERLRAQHWLTYDRNELILASCLRIAQDMEGFVDSSTSTVTSPGVASTQKNEHRTTHFTIDRTGTVCRFLRLAHRINMEQLKLAKLGPVPLPDPPSPEELAQQALDDAALDAELLASPLLRNRQEAEAKREAEAPAEPDGLVTTDLVTRAPSGEAPPRGSSLGDPPTNDAPTPTLNLEPGTLNPAPAHSAHNPPADDAHQIAATTGKPCTCIVQIDSEKISHTRIIDKEQPAWPPDKTPMHINDHHPEPAAASP